MIALARRVTTSWSWPGLVYPRLLRQHAAEIGIGIGMLVTTTGAYVLLILPMFGTYVPDFAQWDFGNHIALVAGAIDTWQTTHAIPLSTDRLVEGTEYPYYLFGNAGFYIIASLVGIIGNVPAAYATSTTLALALLVGQTGTYLLARSFGLSRLYALVIGFLYATGPYLTVNLLVRADFPEFFAWQLVPFACFLGRRAAQTSRARTWIGLALVLSLILYVHKLVGPHILVFVGVLMLVSARWSLGFFSRSIGLAVSVVALTVFAWLPLVLESAEIQTLSQGASGHIAVVNASVGNYLFPWARNSVADVLAAPQYGQRFALQLGLLATIGGLYGMWRLLRRRLRPHYNELFVATGGTVIYSMLVLGIGPLLTRLPFPLNTLQFSYRLLGLAFFSGVLALIVGLAEFESDRGSRSLAARARVFVGTAAVVVACSTITYWRPPSLTTIPLESISAASLIDHNAFYARSFKSLFDTSGAIGADGALGTRPWPIRVAPASVRGPAAARLLPAEAFANPPSTLFLVGSAPVAPADQSRLVRVFGLMGGAGAPCADEAEIASDRPDLISALLRVCDAKRGGGGQPTVAVFGSHWTPVLLAEGTVQPADSITLSMSLPRNLTIVAIECSPAGRLSSASPDSSAPCLMVDYFGPPNQPDHTVRVPRPLPSTAVTRGPFGHWAIRTGGLASGDYVLPTFDYPFVDLTDSAGTRQDVYQFDGREVIRVAGDDGGETYSLGYDVSPELRVLVGWAVAACLVVGILGWRRSRA